MFKERNYNFKANGKGYKQNVKLNAKWHKIGIKKIFKKKR